MMAIQNSCRKVFCNDWLPMTPIITSFIDCYCNMHPPLYRAPNCRRWVILNHMVCHNCLCILTVILAGGCRTRKKCSIDVLGLTTLSELNLNNRDTNARRFAHSGFGRGRPHVFEQNVKCKYLFPLWAMPISRRNQHRR